MSASSFEAPKRTSEAGGGSGWSGIADDVLYNIFGRLHTLHDVFAARAVCRNWRKVAIDAKLSTLSPLLVIRRNDGSEGLFDVTHRRIYSLRFPWTCPERFAMSYSHPHLITNSSTFYGTGHIHLWNLFTGAQIVLPRTSAFFDRILVCPTGLVLLLGGHQYCLQYINDGDASWTVVKSAMPNILLTFRDMIFFQGKLLFLTRSMELLATELRGESLIVRESWGGWVDDHMQWPFLWLGEFDGALFSVRMGLGFEVFRWDSKNKGWEETKDMGDNALFVSLRGRLVFISATQLGLRKNCVYYSVYSGGKREGLWFEFCLEDRSFIEVNFDHPSLFQQVQQQIHPVWVFPNNR